MRAEFRSPRELFSRFLPQLIYGANDGIVTTLAIVAGVVGADLPAGIILILGFANLFADGVSMGASAVLAERSKPGTLLGWRQVWPIGAATFIGFLCAGMIPLIAYLLPGLDGHRFQIAAASAAITLFAVGTSRALVTPRQWPVAGAEMLLIGAAAGGIAYGVGVAGAWLMSNPG